MVAAIKKGIMKWLAALNEDWSDDSSCEIPTEERVKEARESEALELYNKALQYQQQGNHERAKEFYDKLLSSSFVTEAGEKDNEDDPQSNPALAFKYSAYKNLASLSEEQSDLKNAIALYLEAAAIDDSDVTLWYKIGKIAVKVSNVRLARYAFEQGLNCNSKHWPCLDELITVLYAIGDYHSCLQMVSMAFERDISYPKGLIMRDKIYSEYSSFKNDYQNLRGMSNAKNGSYDQSLSSQLVNDALDLRKRNREINKEVEPAPIIPAKHLALYTWSSLGECLVSLYNQVTSDENSLNLCQKVNLENYSKLIIPADAVRNLSTQKSFSKDNEEKRSLNSVKRKKPMTMENDPFNTPKRRSARVSRSKKKQEEINYLEILQEFLPKPLKCTFLNDQNDDSDSMIVSSQENRFEKSGVVAVDGISSEIDSSNISEISSENEPLDVQTFVKKHMNNCGTLDLLCYYANHLKDNCQFKWSSSLVDVFLKIYSKIRPHLSLPPLFCPDTSKKEIMDSAQLVLVAVELTLDKWCTEKSKSSSSLSPAGSPRGNIQSATTSPLKDQGFHEKYFLNDLEYLAHAAGAAANILEKEGLEFSLRVNWAKVRFKMFQGQMQLAVIYLDRCKTLVELSETPITVLLVNCRADNVITIGQVRKKLESLQRCQSLEEVHRLYESGLYQEVVDVLLSSLHQPPPVTKVDNGGMSIPERPAQLLLLQDSLMKLKEYKTCLSCAEVAFNEAVGQMTPCEAWATTLDRLFHCVDTILKQDVGLLDTLAPDKIQRFTQNLIKVIEVSMESAENASDVPLATVMPWILLYRFIASKEDVNESEDMEVETAPAETKPVESEGGETSAENAETPPVPVPQVGLPLSLQFLRLAHEALGGRSWCVSHDGLFLLLYVDVFLKRLNDNSPSLKKNRDKIVRELEQCFFCLYGHPSKKAKARGLQEHGSTQISLTWINSPDIFDFFKPKVLPTFEDKTNTVTSEVQNLLRRITIIVPKSELEVITFESVQNYIDGSCDKVPILPDHMIGVERPVVNAIFYLLADSYFKNKEFSKAIKFYIHDICSNPDRFDTWAAMALARQVRLEDKLRACEPKSEGPIQKHSISTLKCFKRALEIDSSNTNLWGEYGSLSYCLHSYASRQLHQGEGLTPENKKILEDRRTDMLLQAKKCFNEALYKPDNDEPWLQCYMLGKIAEKLCEPPQEYLEYYIKAMKELDKDDAEYPRKIAYHNPPNLALEALEVAFRFHASALKLLMKPTNGTPPNYKVIEKYLDQASLCPFFQANLKINKDDDQAGTKVASERKMGSEDNSEATKEGLETMPVPKNSENQLCDVVTKETLKDSETLSTVYPEVQEDPVGTPGVPEEERETTKPVTHESIDSVFDSSNVISEVKEADDKMEVDVDEVFEPESSLVSTLIQKCMKAISYCLQRFPQHYKSQYRLAHAYLHIPSIKNTTLCRDLLLGSNNACEKPFHLSVQGLLNEKSKTNLFQGIWRIPLDDVDRPGSFCTHMYKSVKLLIDVLQELSEWESLLLVSSLMYRCPDAGKKYLRDNERLQLAAKAFTISLKLLTERFEERKKLVNPNIASTVLQEAYEAYKWSQKVQKHNEETEKLLLNVFKSSALYKDEKSQDDGALLEEVLKYFQLQSKSQSLSDGDDKPSTSKSVGEFPKEEPQTRTEPENDELSSVTTTPNLTSTQEDSLSCLSQSLTITQSTTEQRVIDTTTSPPTVLATPTTKVENNASETVPTLIPDQETSTG